MHMHGYIICTISYCLPFVMLWYMYGWLVTGATASSFMDHFANQIVSLATLGTSHFYCTFPCDAWCMMRDAWYGMICYDMLIASNGASRSLLAQKKWMRLLYQVFHTTLYHCHYHHHCRCVVTIAAIIIIHIVNIVACECIAIVASNTTSINTNSGSWTDYWSCWCIPTDSLHSFIHSR